MKTIALAVALSLAAIPSTAQTVEPAEPVEVEQRGGTLRAVVLPVVALILVTAAVIADD